MPYLPDIPTWETATLNTQNFLGLNRGLSIADGEMADMLNMSCDNYPVLSTRRLRGVPDFDAAGDTAPVTGFDGQVSGMLGTDRLIVCHGEKVYMDGQEMPLTLSAEESMKPKQLVSMGAYVCIWPDKKYFNVTNPDDCGDMGSKWTAAEDASISAIMCRKDGTNYDMESITISDSAPEEPEDQQLWLDTSGETNVLKQYSSIYQEWVQVATTYIKIQATGIGKGLKDSDVVFLSGVRAAEEEGSSGETEEETEETLPFPADDFQLYSRFTTGYQGSYYVSTEATFVSRTLTIVAEGIPEGAVITNASVKFTTNYTAYGAKILTMNGVVFKEGIETEIPVTVTGNGSVSLKFDFKSNNNATSSGTHGGTLNVSGITLEVTYKTSEAGAENIDEADQKQLEALNTSNLIYGCGDDYIIVAGLLHSQMTLANTLSCEMKIPDLAYVCESNNRLWGCSYAETDGTLTNEIRACALGDFRNWYKFEGNSMDSYTMSVGSEGKFTGAFSLQGVPLFFKDNYLHKISGTMPSNYTLNTLRCRGVQDGSWRSLAVVNETLYYKARTDIMAYDGAIPYAVGEKLGTDRYYEAAGGAYRDKYYINMRSEDVVWHTYVLDTAKGLWHKEDESHIPFIANADGVLVLAVEGTDRTELQTVGGKHGSEAAFPWSMTFGVFGYAYESSKYLSRFNIRAQMSAGSEMTVEVMYDSNGEWEQMGTMRSPKLRTFMLPVIPRRCDHCQIRISGTGRINIYSFARVFEQGGN